MLSSAVVDPSLKPVYPLPEAVAVAMEYSSVWPAEPVPRLGQVTAPLAGGIHPEDDGLLAMNPASLGPCLRTRVLYTKEEI